MQLGFTFSGPLPVARCRRVFAGLAWSGRSMHPHERKRAPQSLQSSIARKGNSALPLGLRRRGTSDASPERTLDQQAEAFFMRKRKCKAAKLIRPSQLCNLFAAGRDRLEPEAELGFGGSAENSAARRRRQSFRCKDRTPRSDSPETPRPEVTKATDAFCASCFSGFLPSPAGSCARGSTCQNCQSSDGVRWQHWGCSVASPRCWWSIPDFDSSVRYVRSLNGKLLLELQQTRTGLRIHE